MGVGTCDFDGGAHRLLVPHTPAGGNVVSQGDGGLAKGSQCDKRSSPLL
jgi:hypothetical protein